MMAAIQHSENLKDPATTSRRESRRQKPQADGRRSTRKKSARINKSFDESTSTTKRSTTNQPAKRDRMSSSSRRSTTPAAGHTHERRPSHFRRRQRSMDESPSVSSSPQSVRDQFYGACTDDLIKPASSATPLPWLCTCGQDNDGNQSFCGMCGTSKTWQCAGCDFDNKCKFKFCSMCGIPKTVKTETEEQPEEEEHETTVIAPNEWRCQGCDMVNPCPYIFCSMCGSCKAIGADEELDQQVNASFPPPFVTCNQVDGLDESLRSLESWTGEHH